MPKLTLNNFALIFFISAELTYYLLIAQTGIVESFSSNIYAIAPLPIGGVVGSVIVYFWKYSNKKKIQIFLTFQLLLSFYYPTFNNLVLFALGISVGALAPLLINELKKASFIDLGLALAISYSLGTLLFNYEATQRAPIAVILTLITIVSTFFLPKKEIVSHNQEYSLFVMVLWIFLDSSLFETLSRDVDISIWRDGYSVEIIIFHIIGVITALNYKIEKNLNELFVITLFALSYLFYFIQEAFILSIIYPFVISYYNVLILKSILKKDLKIISVYMVFIGWVASGLGLFVALENLILFVPLLFLFSLITIIIKQETNTKEIHYA
jgi:hypothetical protein